MSTRRPLSAAALGRDRLLCCHAPLRRDVMVPLLARAALLRAIRPASCVHVASGVSFAMEAPARAAVTVHVPIGRNG